MLARSEPPPVPAVPAAVPAGTSGPETGLLAREALRAWDDLAATVPAAVKTAAGWPAWQRIREADRCADIIASGADVRRGGDDAASAEITPGEVLDAVITGLGILACRPGGAGFSGMHWHSPAGQCPECPGPGTLPLFSPPGPGKGVGVFFTPRSLADDVVTPALGVITQPVSMCPAADIEALRVVDPFCRTGAFLVAAARYLGDALAAAWDRRDQAEIGNLCLLYGTSDPVMAARALVISHCLHGADLDPLSVELAGLALQLLAPECPADHALIADGGDYVRHVATETDPGQVRLHARLARPSGPPTARIGGLRCGDSLTGRLRGPGPARHLAGTWPLDWHAEFPEIFGGGQGGFDAVIGNPPFLGGNKIAAALGELYRDHLIAATAGGGRTTADLAVYCWLRMHQLVHSHGVTGIVGPDNMLAGWPEHPCRAAQVAFAVLEQDGWRPYRLARHLRWPARSAAVSICTVWTRRWGGADPPEDLRNVPERPPPGHLWQLSAAYTIGDGHLEIYSPADQSRARARQAAGRGGADLQEVRLMSALVRRARPLKAGYISVDLLHPTPGNRPDRSGDDGLEGLAATIEVLGLLQSLHVEPMPGLPGHYLIRDGWRRWTAAQMAGEEKVHVKVFEPLEGISEAAAAALIGVVTNCQAPLGPVETAMKYATLAKEMSVADIARHTGKSPATISYHLQLAKADEKTLQAVREKKLTAGSVHDFITDLLPGSRQGRPRGGRGQQGRPRPARATAYLNGGHPLAPAAHALCNKERHPAGARIGRVACMPCWERAFRQDQDELARQRGDDSLAATYFNTHPLAAAAHALCEQEGHPATARIGDLACLPCLERTIRGDQDQLARQRGDDRLAAVAS